MPGPIKKRDSMESESGEKKQISAGSNMNRTRETHKGKSIALVGCLTAYAMILSYIESLIPFFFGVPGMKLGLANLAIVLAMYWFGPKSAFLLNFVRVILSAFLFFGMFGLLYSLAGAICSFLSMYFFQRTNRFTILGVSVAGGVFHNIGQILVAYLVFQSKYVLYYLSVLIVSGVVTGFLIGALGSLLDKNYRKFI